MKIVDKSNNESLCFESLELEGVYQLTPYQQRKGDEFFTLLKKGDFVYPGHLKSKMAIDIKLAYDILEQLKAEGFLKKLYEIYCFDCNKSKGIFIESLEEFNPDLYCDFCGEHLTIGENIIALYKVVDV